MFHWPPGKTEICNWMEMSPQVWLREGRQCSMGTFWWLMILQPPFPNQEVRWERKTKQRWAPATPRQSGCPWQRRGGLCQFWATSVPGLLWAQKNVRGRFGNLPSAQDEWLSTEHSLRLSLSLSRPTSLLYTQRRSRKLWQASVWMFTSSSSSHYPESQSRL